MSAIVLRACFDTGMEESREDWRRDLLQKAIERFNRAFEEPGGTAGASSDLFHPDAEIVPLRAALEGTTYRGTDAFARFIEAAHEEFSDYRATIEDTETLGDAVLGRLRMSMVARTSGLPMQVTVYALTTFRGRRILRIHTGFERDTVLADLPGRQ